TSRRSPRPQRTMRLQEFERRRGQTELSPTQYQWVRLNNQDSRRADSCANRRRTNSCEQRGLSNVCYKVGKRSLFRRLYSAIFADQPHYDGYLRLALTRSRRTQPRSPPSDT